VSWTSFWWGFASAYGVVIVLSLMVFGVLTVEERASKRERMKADD
jgi:hypothetical protein